MDEFDESEDEPIFLAVRCGRKKMRSCRRARGCHWLRRRRRCTPIRVVVKDLDDEDEEFDFFDEE